MATEIAPIVMAVVLNWHGGDQTLRCIHSLTEQTYGELNILAVDNGSFDGTLERVAACFPTVSTVQLGHNLGYTGGNNAGIRTALMQGADLVFVVNQDAVVDSECVATLVGAVGPDVAALGPTVYDIDPPYRMQSAGGYFQPWTGRHPGLSLESDTSSRSVDFVRGCAVMFTKHGIEQVGLFNETLFAYHEELDWCLTARERGLVNLHVPGAQAWHRDVGTKSELEQFLVGRNVISVTAKHTSGLKRVSAVSYMSLVDAARRAAVASLKGDWSGASAAAKGPLWHLGLFRSSNPLERMSRLKWAERSEPVPASVRGA